MNTTGAALQFQLKMGLTRARIQSGLATVSGDHSRGATPVPIPNTEVKPSSADGTALATMWESRSSPD